MMRSTRRAVLTGAMASLGLVPAIARAAQAPGGPFRLDVEAHADRIMFDLVNQGAVSLRVWSPFKAPYPPFCHVKVIRVSDGLVMTRSNVGLDDDQVSLGAVVSQIWTHDQMVAGLAILPPGAAFRGDIGLVQFHRLMEGFWRQPLAEGDRYRLRVLTHAFYITEAGAEETTRVEAWPDIQWRFTGDRLVPA